MSETVLMTRAVDSNACMDDNSKAPDASARGTRPPAGLSRRQWLGRLGALVAATYAAHTTGSSLQGGALPLAEASPHADCTLGPLPPHRRVQAAYRLRVRAARTQRDLPLADHLCNGDEDRYCARLGSFHKALPHNHVGEVDQYAYNALLQALHTGNPAAFKAIRLGGTVKLANPQAALTFALEGPDPHHLTIPPAPTLDSAEAAGEMVEVYWQALTRDVPFLDYGRHPSTLAAAAELSTLGEFRGPKHGGHVTPDTVFRGNTPGDLLGPYVSQFLWLDIPYGATTIAQQYRTAVPEVDYMTVDAEWLAIQNGTAAGPTVLDPLPRYLRNGRDLGEYVHRDFTYQAFLNAALILLSTSGVSDPGNPYLVSPTQGGFLTFGGPHILDLVARAARCALLAAWYQKWQVHRRLRPEAYGGLVHHHLAHTAAYPFLPAEILDTGAVAEVLTRFGTALLPMAYPEGCPTHPAYPAGHAAIAGACVTVLKAFFHEGAALPHPVEASADGLTLHPYAGAALTVGNELNKLAANIAIGRNTAGVHWRSDGIEGLQLGEAVAIGLLTDLGMTYHESGGRLSLTTFDGAALILSSSA